MPDRAEQPRTVPTSYHWGSFDVEVADGRVRALTPAADVPERSPIGRSIAGTLDDPARIRRPMVRAGYLARALGKPGASGGEGRGGEPFVAVSWDQAFDLVAGELKRVRAAH